MSQEPENSEAVTAGQGVESKLRDPAAVPRGLLKENLAVQLREEILGGRLVPGEKIIEGRWARQLGVAQVSIREALNILAAEGFVTKGHSFRTYDWDRATALVDRLMVGYNLAEELERTRGIDGGQTNRSSNTDHCPQRANSRSVFYPARKRG